MINNKELKLILGFLNQLSDKLSNAGCNDWEFPSDWTDIEKLEFVKGFHDWNGDPEEFDSDNLVVSDFCVVMYLASKL